MRNTKRQAAITRLGARLISVFVLNSKHLLAAALAFAGAAGHAEAPTRVVSMNVCTDQLAMMIASEGQLYSVSTLAYDPRTSAMAEEAKGYFPNSGRAEEVFLMSPDLILAGQFTARASVDMLERLGLRVIRFEPAYALADIPKRLREMGAALGREARAEALIAEYEAALEALKLPENAPRPRAVQYVANGFTQGQNTLTDEMLELAGLSNIAAELGISYGARLPLELLAMAEPDLLVTAAPYPGASRSEEIPNHPVAKAVTAGHEPHRMSPADWLCGTPYILRAVEALAEARERIVSQ